MRAQALDVREDRLAQLAHRDERGDRVARGNPLEDVATAARELLDFAHRAGEGEGDALGEGAFADLGVAGVSRVGDGADARAGGADEDFDELTQRGGDGLDVARAPPFVHDEERGPAVLGRTTSDEREVHRLLDAGADEHAPPQVRQRQRVARSLLGDHVDDRAHASRPDGAERFADAGELESVRDERGALPRFQRVDEARDEPPYLAVLDLDHLAEGVHVGENERHARSHEHVRGDGPLGERDRPQGIARPCAARAHPVCRAARPVRGTRRDAPRLAVAVLHARDSNVSHEGVTMDETGDRRRQGATDARAARSSHRSRRPAQTWRPAPG